MSPANQKSERTARTGWFSMLVVGTIVISAGFAVGIVAGVTWEEPGLVIGWLTGETDGIEWTVEDRELAESGDDGSRLVPGVSAAPPLGESASKTFAAVKPEAPQRSAPISVPRVPQVRRETSQPVSKSRSSSKNSPDNGKFSVQVGAFADRAGADGLSTALRRAGYTVYLSDSRQGARWRVRVGPHRTREAAERTAERLKSGQQLPTWVLSEES